MNLYNTIYQLVCDNDCVIIHGFGGFVTNRFPADVDFSKQEFYPPSRKVAFNENLSLSDGLLLNYISQTENVSLPKREASSMGTSITAIVASALFFSWKCSIFS